MFMRKFGIGIGVFIIIVALLYFMYMIYSYEDKEDLIKEKTVNQTNVVNTNIERRGNKI